MQNFGEIILAVVVALIGAGVTFLVAYLGFSREKKKRDLRNARLQGERDSAFNSLKEDFDRERGGNSGGFRQAINAILTNQENFEKNQMKMMQTQGEINTKVEVVGALLEAHIKQHDLKNI